MTGGFFYGSPATALNTLTQIHAAAATTQYSKWDREREREKEKNKKEKRKSEFALHLQSELKLYPEEGGYYFEARA